MAETPNWTEINDKVIAAFRANHGKVGGHFEGSPILLLHTNGARTGKRYVIPLTYLPDGDRFVVFASNTGAPTHPSWFHNLLAHPEVTLEVGDDTFLATATVAESEERQKLYDQQAAVLPRYQEYQKRTERIIPVVILTRNG
jgi:deazaflavin-dependent oxidoreductase (nitroreductase family)